VIAAYLNTFLDAAIFIIQSPRVFHRNKAVISRVYEQNWQVAILQISNRSHIFDIEAS
jgi:hypothetical protein